MLISKTAMVRWSSLNKKRYEDKGYIFTKMGYEFKVKVEDLSNGSEVLVDIQCDGCDEILSERRWDSYKKYVHEDGKYYCVKCANKLFASKKATKTKLKNSKSFYQWCYDNLFKEEADIIISRWDNDLNVDENGNKLSPKDVSYNSQGLNGKGYWFKCLDHPEHTSKLKRISNFVKGEKSLNCNQCNSISITNPELIKYLVNKEDAIKYSKGANNKILMKCSDCGYKKERSINTLLRRGFGCNKCSDGVSYPNKFGFGFLDQIKNLNIILNFQTEKTFNWLKFKFKYQLRKGFIDFYFEINGREYGIEMDGGFHSKDNKMNGQTKEESKFIDDEKDRLCREHKIKIIRINSDKSEMEWIKNSIMNSELPKLLKFKEEDIDWLKCHEAGCKNIIKVVCGMWIKGTKNILKIANQIKVDKATIRKYLKQGAKLGWCDYNSEEENIKNRTLGHQKRNKQVICLTTSKIFNSIKQASTKYNIQGSTISACCKKINKSAGKNPETGEPLKWMYYDEYIKLQSPTQIFSDK
jgi:hypothetical protein